MHLTRKIRKVPSKITKSQHYLIIQPCEIVSLAGLVKQSLRKKFLSDDISDLPKHWEYLHHIVGWRIYLTNQ